MHWDYFIRVKFEQMYTALLSIQSMICILPYSKTLGPLIIKCAANFSIYNIYTPL